ncbi:MAG: DUF1207 domain-containing protein [Planctomycetaceae bacterium]
MALGCPPASAQDPDPYLILPPFRYFESPFADPIEPRMSIGLLTTDVLASQGGERDPFLLPDPDDADFDVQAAAAVGGTVPLLRLSHGPHGGVIFSGQAGVFARFRIEYPSRDDLGQDWIVAGAFEMKHDNASGRVRISHRSSHLGDEFVQVTDAERIEFGGEALDALAAYTFPGIVRVYGGGSWIFRSYTEEQVLALVRIGRKDRFLVQLGADGEWRPWGNLGFTGGLDWQTAERTGWKNALALAGGLSVDANGRSLSLVARWFDGVSSLGEFFLTPETFWSLELLAVF